VGTGALEPPTGEACPDCKADAGVPCECSLTRLGLCPDCQEKEDREAEAAAYDAWVDNEIKWQQEERLLGVEL
jgi:hypothetical protein